MNLKYVLIVVVAGVAKQATAVDIPFGADALPYLGERASHVIQASNPTVRPVPRQDGAEGVELVAYDATVESVLKGDQLKKGDKITITAPKPLDVASAESLAPAVLFLSGDVESEVRDRLGLGKEDELFRLVAGRYGAVAIGNDHAGRLPAIQEYLAAPRADPADGAKPTIGERRLNWAQANSKDKDPFLQRSAVLSLFAHSHQQEVVTALSDVLKSDAVQLENKRLAVNGLRYSGSDRAVQPLKMVAENVAAPKTLRATAVQAVGSLPGGKEQLKEWSRSPDALLRPSATKEMQRYDGSKGRTTPKGPPDAVKAP